jgi:hypothetical protein
MVGRHIAPIPEVPTEKTRVASIQVATGYPRYLVLIHKLCTTYGKRKPRRFDHGVSHKLFAPEVPDKDGGPNAAPQRPHNGLQAPVRARLRVRDPAAS